MQGTVNQIGTHKLLHRESTEVQSLDLLSYISGDKQTGGSTQLKYYVLQKKLPLFFTLILYYVSDQK